MHMTERLLKAADAIKDDVCSLICPSQWPTGKRPPHHPKCVDLRAAISEAIDEQSYADLLARPRQCGDFLIAAAVVFFVCLGAILAFGIFIHLARYHH